MTAIPARAPRAAAFAAEYERHHQALYRYCRSILRHEQDAQDALQSTMTRAFAALPDEPRDVDLRPWLFRIAHNEAVSILRGRRPTAELDDSLGGVSALEERVEAREALRVLRRDLADLAERQRAALVLRELNGLDHAEIAHVLDTTPGAVKQAIFEARGALSTCRAGRAMACREVQRVLSDGDGRVLRGRGVRAHLRECAGCRSFQADLARRPGELAALAPPLPAGAAAAVLAALQASAGTTAGVWSAATASGLAAKVAIGVVLVAGGAGAAESARPAPAARAPAAVRTPVAPAPRIATWSALSTTPAGERPPARSRRAIARRTEHASAAPRETRRSAATARETTSAATAPSVSQAGPPARAPGLMKHARAVAPPGQAKHAGATPPGQTKHASAVAPPGQTKHDGSAAPPGQTKRAAHAPPAATAEPGTASPGASGDAPGHGADGPPGQQHKPRSSP